MVPFLVMGHTLKPEFLVSFILDINSTEIYGMCLPLVCLSLNYPNTFFLEVRLCYIISQSFHNLMQAHIVLDSLSDFLDSLSSDLSYHRFHIHRPMKYFFIHSDFSGLNTLESGALLLKFRVIRYGFQFL